MPYNSLRPKLAGVSPVFAPDIAVSIKILLVPGGLMMGGVQDILGARPGSGNILPTHIPLSRTNHMFSSYRMRDGTCGLAGRQEESGTGVVSTQSCLCTGSVTSLRP